MHIFVLYSSFYICIHIGNYHTSQDTEHFHHSRCSSASAQSVLCLFPKSNYQSPFFYISFASSSTSGKWNPHSSFVFGSFTQPLYKGFIHVVHLSVILSHWEKQVSYLYFKCFIGICTALIWDTVFIFYNKV